MTEEHDLETDMQGLLDDISKRIDKIWLHAKLMAAAAFATGLCAGLLAGKYLW